MVLAYVGYTKWADFDCWKDIGEEEIEPNTPPTIHQVLKALRDDDCIRPCNRCSYCVHCRCLYPCSLCDIRGYWEEQC